MSVYTLIDKPTVEALIKAYAIGQLIDFKGITAGTTNSNYTVTTTQGEYVLTLFERADQASLDFYLALLAHLKQHHYPCAAPIADQQNTIIHQVAGKPAVFVPKLQGITLTQVQIPHCQAIGSVLAKLHLVTKDFQIRKPNPWGISWQVNIASSLLAKITSDEAKLIKSELKAQQAIDYDQLPKGIIHADLFRDNALFVDTTLCGIIDFDYVCYDSMLLDLAISVNDWGLQIDNTLDNQRCQALIDSYQQLRPLTQSERQLWPWMLRFAALRWWLARLNAKLHAPKNKQVLIKDPKEFEALLRNHQQSPQQL